MYMIYIEFFLFVYCCWTFPNSPNNPKKIESFLSLNTLTIKKQKFVVPYKKSEHMIFSIKILQCLFCTYSLEKWKLLYVCTFLYHICLYTCIQKSIIQYIILYTIERELNILIFYVKIDYLFSSHTFYDYTIIMERIFILHNYIN